MVANGLPGKPRVTLPLSAGDHRTAVDFLLDWLESQPVFPSVKAAGHRVVQGMKHSEPERVTPKLLAELRRITAYDPDHLPREISLIEALQKRHPKLPQVACFDVYYLARSERMSAAGFQRMVNHESGLPGVSATSSDLRDLCAREALDERAAAAVDLFCYQARKWIGSFAAALGGIETLVFSAGIGENAPRIRAHWYGLPELELDHGAPKSGLHSRRSSVIYFDAEKTQSRAEPDPDLRFGYSSPTPTQA